MGVALCTVIDNTTSIPIFLIIYLSTKICSQAARIGPAGRTLDHTNSISDYNTQKSLILLVSHPEGIKMPEPLNKKA